jgi:hypothetical protein
LTNGLRILLCKWCTELANVAQIWQKGAQIWQMLHRFGKCCTDLVKRCTNLAKCAQIWQMLHRFGKWWQILGYTFVKVELRSLKQNVGEIE